LAAAVAVRVLGFESRKHRANNLDGRAGYIRISFCVSLTTAPTGSLSFILFAIAVNLVDVKCNNLSCLFSLFKYKIYRRRCK